MKDHEIAQLVNALVVVAKDYHGTQQLRERIAGIIVPAIKSGLPKSVVRAYADDEESMEAEDQWARDQGDLAYWRGVDEGCAGIAGRWKQALEDPIPAPGVMNEPFESLYRRTEKLRERAELGECAMRFVDRAGDVDPVIDPAEKICDEFNAAMAKVIDKYHPMPINKRGKW